ncbi:helix-turn-helix domain-containing protein [Nitriliruptor alkaliphilus]|uniref:helix-turn-helix domain-containing protein n=1 Tax=Nitriliruptor alkaliphilus TaxID=427918 RepID=UPI0006974775|nr:helix-turn-helix domain-containing protein [Nitriliruptor alkaliphilus]
MLLNADLCIRRRQELGLSQRELARRMGMTAAVIERIEAGTNHNDLPLAMVAALADALALDIRDMVTPDPPSREPSDQDVDQLAAFLFDTGWVPQSAICELLGWTPERTSTAIDELERRLDRTGLAVQHRNGQSRLLTAMAPDDTEQRAQTIHAHLRRSGMTASQARTLHRALDGIEERQIASVDDRNALGTLRNAGYVTRDTHVELTDAVKFSLLLDQE